MTADTVIHFSWWPLYDVLAHLVDSPLQRPNGTWVDSALGCWLLPDETGMHRLDAEYEPPPSASPGSSPRSTRGSPTTCRT